MTNSLCHYHIKSLLPKKEYCVICLLEEQYGLRDELENLTWAMIRLLEKLKDLLATEEYESALGKAKARLEQIYGTPLPEEVIKHDCGQAK